MSTVDGAQAQEQVVARGTFACPIERQEASYVVKHVVLDGAELGEYVLCRSCGSEFAPKVLNADEHAQETSLHEALSLLFSAMIIADGVIKEPELVMARQLLARHDIDYDTDVLKTDSKRVLGDLADILREASRHLSLANRRLLLEGATLIGHADRELRVEERDLILNAGRHMGFTRSAIAELLDAAATRPRDA